MRLSQSRRDEHASDPSLGGLADAQPLASLRMLVFLCVALSLVAFVAVGAWRWQQLRADALVRIDTTLRIAREHAVKVLDTGDAVLWRAVDLATDANGDPVRLRGAAQRLRDQLQAMSGDEPNVLSLRIVDAQGRIALEEGRNADTTDLAAVLAAAKLDDLPGEAMRIAVFQAKPGAEPVVTLSRRFSHPDGRFAGVIVLSLPSSFFNGFYRDLAADEPGLTLTLFHRGGAILARYPVRNETIQLGAGGVLLSHVLRGEERGRVSGISTVDDQRRIVDFARLGDYPVYLGTGIVVDAIWTRWLRDILWLAGFGLPPMIGLYLVARVALRRARSSLQTAARLTEETAARQHVEEALLQAQKLEALGRLTGGVAHDFNNALMVISSNLYLLKRKHPQAMERYGDSISRAVESATKLTRQLLAFSRRQALLPERIDLRQRLPDLRDLLAPVLGARIAVVLDVEPDTRPILVDSAELELALLNLAINARDAMSGSGRFRLHAFNARELPPLVAGPMVVLEASDSGCGIAPDLIARVFEPFFTTKPMGQGTGLGLSQVYGLCQRAGGTATVRSAPGQGTTVSLFFPAQEARAPVRQSSAQRSEPALGKRILLVEDNEQVAVALRSVLDSMGCEVRHFASASPALEWLQAQAELPDLLLSDVVMPGEMDGAALAGRVRTIWPQLRIVLMTGYAQQIDAITGMGFEVIPKPCSAEMLAEVLARETPVDTTG